MKRIQRGLALLMTLLCVSAAAGCSSSAPQSTLTLWYAESECSRAAMTSLLDAYQKETNAVVDAVAFADEAALGAAFASGQPDLLFCSLDRAARMDTLAPLPALSIQNAYADTITDVSPLIAGGSFFPIGARLPLLLVNTALASPDYSSLEALLDAAADNAVPFLGADSWADLLYQGMFSLGRELTGLEKADARDESYRALYNRLAEAAYAGGLARLDADAAAYVRQGLLPCAAVSSTVLAGIHDEALAVRLPPPPVGGRALWSAELMGFVPLNAKSANAAFLAWLTDGGRAAELALAAGLAPVTDGAADGTEDDLEALLLSLWQDQRLRYRPAGSDYALNRADCEQSLRRHLDLLA
ncbi:MAG: extracellular solute-binding protein [Oscillospiraceae bacterium]|nr:extracellular solute-binding protein [Oscillospiraceae bacterium]